MFTCSWRRPQSFDPRPFSNWCHDVQVATGVQGILPQLQPICNWILWQQTTPKHQVKQHLHGVLVLNFDLCFTKLQSKNAHFHLWETAWNAETIRIPISWASGRGTPGRPLKVRRRRLPGLGSLNLESMKNGSALTPGFA